MQEAVWHRKGSKHNRACLSNTQSLRMQECTSSGVSRPATSISCVSAVQEALEPGPLELLWWMSCEIQVIAKARLTLNDLLKSHRAHVTLLCFEYKIMHCVMCWIVITRFVLHCCQQHWIKVPASLHVLHISQQSLCHWFVHSNFHFMINSYLHTCVLISLYFCTGE